jgi:exonuclease III
MSGQLAAPFTMLYQNIQSFPSRLAQWQQIVHGLDVSLPTTPLLYAFVESGHAEPKPGMPAWLCSHHAGAEKNGGGISLLYHKSCPISSLPQHTVTFLPQHHANASASTAMVWHQVRPAGRAAFLLATVYLPPQNAPKHYYMTQILQSLDAVPQLFDMPVLVVGDFNLRHADWHQQPHNAGAAGGPATSLADWIGDNDYNLANQPGQYTHFVLRQDGTSSTSIVDLVFASDPDLVSSMSTTEAQVAALTSDHCPITISMQLTATVPPDAPPPCRPRLAWDHLREPSAWQQLLPHALHEALLPLQPRLDTLATGAIPAAFSPQMLLDSVYEEFEQLVAETCLAVVGTRVLARSSRAWFGQPGVRDAYAVLRSTATAMLGNISDAALYAAHTAARKAWRAVSAAAKLQDYTDLCTAVALDNQKARWALFKRTAPSQHTPLSTIVHPDTGVLPVDHLASLDNLCSAFVASSEPAKVVDLVAYAALARRVAGWADTALPAQLAYPPIPAHCSDAWTFPVDAVQRQCQRQHTSSAPGPDSILPIFLKYAGDDGWQALATIFTFSWRFSVTPLAWREANVMALYKQAGSKALPASYRPISMTSIVARTFEHLVHHRLVALLDPPPPPPPPLPQPEQPVLPLPPAAQPFFCDTQFGFRRGRTTHDAIHYLLSNIQHLLRFKAKDLQHPYCPVLFLDIKKAFDRVDHKILLQRLHDAGITGRAWLWIRSFLSHRRIRTVDDSLCSSWQQIQYGVPQGACSARCSS